MRNMGRFAVMAVFGLLGLLFAPLGAKGSDPAEWPVNVSIGGFQKEQKVWTVEKLTEIRDAGFSAVELSLSAAGFDWPEEKRTEWLQAFKKNCDAAGLPIWSVHVPFSGSYDVSIADEVKRNDFLEKTIALMEANQTLGAKVFVIHPSSEPIADADRPARFAQAVTSLKQLSAEAKKRGIQLAVENLPRTCLANCSSEANELLTAVGDGVKLCFDANHLLRETPEEFLAGLTIPIATTHISDYDRIDERHWAPYEGRTDWKAVLTELAQKDYPGPFLFEGAGRPDKTRLSWSELYERWRWALAEYQTGFPPAAKLWPADEWLAEKVTFEKVGEPNGPVQAIYYDSVPFQGKPTKVFAYLGTPDQEKFGDGPFPAVLLIHGGGGSAFPEWAQFWAQRGYVALAMDLAGCGPDKQRHTDAGPGQDDGVKFRAFTADDFRDMWTYHAIAAILKGHALLKTLPNVDADRIAATGISWGGYLTSMLSGVDSELKCFVPVYGCGFLHENSCWKDSKIFDNMTPEQLQRWVALFDPSSHLPRSTAPMLWVNGTNDFAYPLDSYQKCYRLPTGPRTLAIAINRPHGHIWTFPEVDAFIDSILIEGAKPLLTVSPTEFDGTTAQATVSGEIAPVKAELFVTSDTGAWQKKNWQVIPATIDGATVSATVPADARCFFFSLTDDRGLTVSSEHWENHP